MNQWTFDRWCVRDKNGAFFHHENYTPTPDGADYEPAPDGWNTLLRCDDRADLGLHLVHVRVTYAIGPEAVAMSDDAALVNDWLSFALDRIQTLEHALRETHCKLNRETWERQQTERYRGTVESRMWHANKEIERIHPLYQQLQEEHAALRKESEARIGTIADLTVQLARLMPRNDTELMRLKSEALCLEQNLRHSQNCEMMLVRDTDGFRAAAAQTDEACKAACNAALAYVSALRVAEEKSP